MKISFSNAFFIDDSTSRIGIGTASPSATLHVAGGFLATASSTIDGNLTVTGNLTITGNSTTTQATTTNFAISSITSSILSTDANGSVIATTTIGPNLIEDVYLRNDANDTTTGQLTALNFVASGAAATSTFAGGLTIDGTDFLMEGELVLG